MKRAVTFLYVCFISLTSFGQTVLEENEHSEKVIELDETYLDAALVIGSLDPGELNTALTGAQIKLEEIGDHLLANGSRNQKLFTHYRLGLFYVKLAEHYGDVQPLHQFSSLTLAEGHIEKLINEQISFPIKFKRRDQKTYAIGEESFMQIKDKLYISLAVHHFMEVQNYSSSFNYFQKLMNCCALSPLRRSHVYMMLAITRHKSGFNDDYLFNNFERFMEGVHSLSEEDQQNMAPFEEDIVEMVDILSNKDIGFVDRKDFALQLVEYADLSFISSRKELLKKIYEAMVVENLGHASNWKTIIQFSEVERFSELGKKAIQRLIEVKSGCDDLQFIVDYSRKFGDEITAQKFEKEAKKCRKKEEWNSRERHISIGWNAGVVATPYPKYQDWGGIIAYEKRRFYTQFGVLLINNNNDRAMDVAYFNRSRRNPDGESNYWNGFRTHAVIGGQETSSLKKSFFRYGLHVGFSRQNFNTQDITWRLEQDTTQVITESLAPKLNMYEMGFNYHFGKKYGPIAFGAESILGLHVSTFNSTSSQDPTEWVASKMLLSRKNTHLGLLIRMNLYLHYYLF